MNEESVLVNKKSVSVNDESVSGNKESVSVNEKSVSVIKENKKHSNSYNNFVTELKKTQAKDSVLNMLKVTESWNRLTVYEKSKYKYNAEDEKGESSELEGEESSEISGGKSAHEKRKERDRLYRRHLATLKSEEQSEKNKFVKDFEEILKQKEEKILSLKLKKDNLCQEIAKSVSEIEVLERMTNGKTEEEINYKSEFRSLYNHNKMCKK